MAGNDFPLRDTFQDSEIVIALNKCTRADFACSKTLNEDNLSSFALLDLLVIKGHDGRLRQLEQQE